MQLACIASAFWVALTRVKDHMHHPGDVIAGALIGTLIQVSTGCIKKILFNGRWLESTERFALFFIKIDEYLYNQTVFQIVRASKENLIILQIFHTQKRKNIYK